VVNYYKRMDEKKQFINNSGASKGFVETMIKGRRKQKQEGNDSSGKEVVGRSTQTWALKKEASHWCRI
jgi:hypothetical protein